ncbi:hypothetical protein K4K49_009807 [Colletotrichum sp. SAR 10_70]|nr:hypothetical protein K4K50_012349 [Colletotrichum sp. SAR 10_71]KAI8154197.1 hypothetical protein K4K49_009807 [Colletotrichum sp. SAR 10_70]KAI8156226.1 hypothetical protein KHU50_009922 [Colletotrichum sp. SAR 10_65]KAI8216372.1 hypothetical protein K4K53_010178 [Colletotrichum sp. SAR 10_77]
MTLPSPKCLPSLINTPLLQVQHLASQAVVTSPTKLRSLPANHGRASEDATSKTPPHSQFSDLDYEGPQFDLGGNSPEPGDNDEEPSVDLGGNSPVPGDNDEDMAPASSTEGRSSSSWETRLEKLFQTSHVDVSPRDMMLVVPSMVNDENDSSYGTSKAGLVFDFPLPPEHRFAELQECDKVVLLLHHAQTNGKWTCLHIVNYSAGTRNLVVACHIDCAPDRQPYDERPFPTLSENGKKRPFSEEPGSPEDPGECKRRFLAHWTSKAAEEDECTRAAEFIPQMEKRKRRLGSSQDKLLHASSAAVNEVSRRKLIKKWASKVALLKEDHDNQDSDDQDSDDQDSDDQDSDDQNSNAEDIGIRQATDAFIELARAAGYNGESVDKATKDVKSAVKRSKELKCNLSAVCSSAEKVNTAITDLVNFKRQQEVLREALTAVGRLDPENWVQKEKVDLLVKEMTEETHEEDT